MMKKTLSLILALALCLGLAAPAMGVEEDNVNRSAVTLTTVSNDELVRDFWESINSGDWGKWVSYYPSSLQEYYQNFATPGNVEAGVGILAVEHVCVDRVTKLDNGYAPKVYPELQTYFEREETYACYKVDVTLKVKENNDYFSNGSNSYLTILVNDTDGWHVGVVSGCAVNAEESAVCLTNSISATGIGQGFIDLIPEPKSITVKDEKGEISTVKFSDFLLNVTCNEIGNLGYNVQAIRAQIMAVKMFGWWAKAGRYRAAENCDVKHDDVAYKSYNGATAGNAAKIKTEIETLNGFYMVSSVGTGGKLFSANYRAGKANADGKGGGKLYQEGANYLANTMSYNWMQLLHYYYDNSTYNHPDVGIVQIIDPTSSTVSVGDVDE